MMKRVNKLFLCFILLFNSLSLSLLAQDMAYINTSYKYLENGNIEVLFNLTIDQNWYLYGASKVSGGPLNASFELDSSSPATLVGELKDGDGILKKFDTAFNVEVFYYQGVASFSQEIKPASSDSFILKGTLVYQTCNGAECLINESDIELKVSFDNHTQKEVVSHVATSSGNNTQRESILWFLLVAFAAGLGGVVTPCVFPMIPMTVGFLIGGGSTKKAGIMNGVIFGLSVILIYTILGLLVSLFGSTAATDALGTHWIPNLIFAILFIIFSISFLGAFEIILPSGLANKADKQADKGGYLAAFFVALAMVIVSFSCTGPFVGSILAAGVVGGVALKPILGMAIFGFAFSLPFVLCSLFPSLMKKLPKSGGWLNVVKVVFAFVLMAFAVKFLYNVDVYFGIGMITRLGFLSIWIALAILLTLYFLGIIRTKHDSPIDGLGWGRVVAALVSLSFSIYMIPGLFGAPLKSISGFIPPVDDSIISISHHSKERYSDDKQLTSGYASLDSFNTIEDAILASKNSGNPILLSFKSHTCSVCKVMESTVLSSPDVLNTLRDGFVVANLYVDDKTPDEKYKTLGRRLRKYQTEKFGSASQPLYVVINASEEILSPPKGSCSEEEFLEFLNY